MKKIFLAMIALGATIAVAAQTKEYTIKVGDQVYVQRSATNYLTGEKISNWVYDTAMTVQQIGCNWYPEGVLLAPISSWVSMEAVGAKQVEPEPQPQPQPQPEPQPQPQPQPEPLPAPIPPTPVAEPEPEPVVEPAPQPVVEDWTPQSGRPAEHRFGIGLRGGIASLCQATDARVVNGKRKIGGEGAIDLEYTYLSHTLNSGLCQVGFKTGLSLAFAGNSFTANGALTTYRTQDQNGRDITYINAISNVKESNKQFMMEIPVMFALRGTKGFSFAIGPKINIPVAGWYKMNYSDPLIDCYYEQKGVHEINEVVTGKLDGVAQTKDNKLRTATFNLMMASEIGYEWTLKNGNGLGLLAYGGYYVVSGYKLNSDPAQGFLYVDGPKAGGPTITGNSLMNDCGLNMGYLNAGIKLTYQFSFPAKK